MGSKKNYFIDNTLCIPKAEPQRTKTPVRKRLSSPTPSSKEINDNAKPLFARLLPLFQSALWTQGVEMREPQQLCGMEGTCAFLFGCCAATSKRCDYRKPLAGKLTTRSNRSFAYISKGLHTIVVRIGWLQMDRRTAYSRLSTVWAMLGDVREGCRPEISSENSDAETRPVGFEQMTREGDKIDSKG